MLPAFTIQCVHCSHMCRFFGHTSAHFARRVAISICPTSDYDAVFFRLAQNSRQAAASNQQPTATRCV